MAFDPPFFYTLRGVNHSSPSLSAWLPLYCSDLIVTASGAMPKMPSCYVWRK